MADSVAIDLEIDSVAQAEELPTKTYRLDLDKGRIYGYVDKQKAMQQAIRKALITPRFKCLIYSNQYGSEIEDAVICNDATREYVRSVVPGFIKDALLPDARVLEVEDVEFEFQDDGAYINFTASTIFGKVVVEEVI